MQILTENEEWTSEEIFFFKHCMTKFSSSGRRCKGQKKIVSPKEKFLKKIHFRHWWRKCSLWLWRTKGLKIEKDQFQKCKLKLSDCHTSATRNRVEDCSMETFEATTRLPTYNLMVESSLVVLGKYEFEYLVNLYWWHDLILLVCH